MNITEPLDIVQGSFSSINDTINQLVITILILLLGFIIGKLIGRLIHLLFREIDLDGIVRHSLRLNISISSFLVFIFSYSIYAAAFVIAFERLKLMAYILYVLIGIVIIVFIMSIVGSVKDFFPNVVAGLALRKRGLEPGKRLALSNISGTITDFSLLSTTVKVGNKESVVLPNSYLLKNRFRVRRK